MRRGARTVIIQASISANTGTGDIVFMIPAARAPDVISSTSRLFATATAHRDHRQAQHRVKHEKGRCRQRILAFIVLGLVENAQVRENTPGGRGRTSLRCSPKWKSQRTPRR